MVLALDEVFVLWWEFNQKLIQALKKIYVSIVKFFVNNEKSKISL